MIRGGYSDAQFTIASDRRPLLPGSWGAAARKATEPAATTNRQYTAGQPQA
jgi:hypothetical protein